jgi:replicative DNA helicase
MAEKRDYSTLLFTPEEIGALGSQYLRQRREDKGLGVALGLKSLDDEDKDGNSLLPLMPGELMTILGRPGNGKTSFMVRWARYRADFLRTNKIENKAVVYVTLEQSIEELNAFNVAAEKRISITKMAKGAITDAEWKGCLEEGLNRRFQPLWNIGYSSMTDKKQIRLDADAIAGALALIRDQHKLTIDLVFVDYLQRIPYDRAESKTVGVSDNLDTLKLIAQRARCPMVVGVQAKREVDDQDAPIPGEDDGQWTSNIEQTSDKLLSLVRPRKYKQDGEKFGSTMVQGNCQMLISVLKQKLGPANFAKWVFFDPIYNKLDELEMRHV